MSRRETILFVALCIVWGIPYFFIRVAVADLSPTVVVFGRTAVGALVLLPITLRRRELWPAFRHFWPLLVYTVAEMGVPWLFLSTAEIQLPSSVSGLLIAVVPAVGTLLALVAGIERPDVRRVAGLVVGLGGVGAMLGLGMPGATPLVLAEVALVVVGYAVGPQIVAKKLADAPSLGVVTASLGMCALGYAPFAIIQLPTAMPALLPVVSVIVLGVVCTALAFVIAFSLIASIGPVRMTVVTYVNPAVAVVMGVALLGEHLTLGMGVGFALILLGSYLTTRPLKGAPMPPPAAEVA